MAVGSGSGQVFILSESNGLWEEEAVLSAPNDDIYDCFGCVVNIWDNWVSVGVPGDDANGELAGRIDMYERMDGQWLYRQSLTPQDPIDYHHFGSWITILDNSLLIGATGDDNEGINSSGAAYVFERTDMEWTQTAKLVPSEPVAQGSFGQGVALAGDYAFVGDTRARNEAGVKTGAVYVFQHNNGQWTQQAKLTPSDGQASDGFGWVKAISDNYLTVGASQAPGNNEYYKGAVYIFTREGNTWTEQQKIITPDGDNIDKFLRDYSFSGNYLALASASGVNEAPVYLFRRNGSIWEEVQVFTSSQPENERYGHEVYLTNDYLFVGAMHHRVAIEEDTILAGGVYIYDLDEIVNTATPTQVTFQLFPNPTHEWLTITAERALIENLQIFDANGRLVRTLLAESAGTKQQCTVDLAILPSGLYVLRGTVAGKTVTRQFIKE
ncbi:MAG: T9SS type A sorting domain-containing protein [Bacteroidota bacterium]